MGNDLLDSVALSFANGLGAKGYWRLLDVFGNAETVLKHPPAELQFRTGLKTSQVEGVLPDKLRALADKEIEELSNIGGHVVVPSDSNYPLLLKEISDPPPVLYVQGNLSLLNEIAVAVVGSRASTSYGRRVAANLGRDIGATGVTVVSGLALGIDTQAHEGALAAHGNTVAALGCGLDVVYPWQNKKLYDRIRVEGLLVTEYPLGTKPDGFRFPARNRIIAGMSRGVIVVEAAKKSGSLITAQLALDFNREIFAVPGQIDSVKSEGTHWLLQQGAKLVQRVDDVLEELPIVPKVEEVEKSVAVQEVSQPAQKLLDMLDSYPVNKEELIVKLGLPVEEVAELLLFLELDDFIEILPGDMVRRL